jgi:hypothetical protein
MASLLKESPQLMGDYLVARGLLSPQALATALREQASTATPLGKVLMHQGAIAPQPMQQAMAQRDNIPYIDLTSHSIDSALLSPDYCNDYALKGYIPVALEGGTLVIATTHISEALRSDLEAEYGYKIMFMLTSPYDILWAVKRLLGKELDENSREKLFRERPIRSARYRLTSRITKPLLVLIIATAISLWSDIVLVAIIIALNLFYVATLGLKIALFVASLFYKAPEGADFLALTLSDSDLHIYRVHVPMYHEAATVPHVLRALRALDYPRSKLDIKLIVEADDAETIAAIKTARPEAMFEMIRVECPPMFNLIA